MPDLFEPAATFTVADKLACVEREVKMRRRVYPHWTASGKMRVSEAEREIAVMEAIADDYRARLC